MSRDADQYAEGSDFISTYEIKSTFLKLIGKEDLQPDAGKDADQATLNLTRYLRALELAFDEKSLLAFFIPSVNLVKKTSRVLDSEEEEETKFPLLSCIICDDVEHALL